MFGNPVGTTMTFRPLGRIVSVARNGRMSPAGAAFAARGDGELLARCAALAEGHRDSTHIEMRCVAVAVLARLVLEDARSR